MAIALGEARKNLSADALFRSLRSHFGSLPDPRSGEVEIPLDDALMSAFAMFSLKDPSLLAFDDRRRDANDNFRTWHCVLRLLADLHRRFDAKHGVTCSWLQFPVFSLRSWRNPWD